MSSRRTRLAKKESDQMAATNRASVARSIRVFSECRGDAMESMLLPDLFGRGDEKTPINHASIGEFSV